MTSNSSKSSQSVQRSVNGGMDFRTPQDFVTIVVSGNQPEQKFGIHKQLITFHSPFFKAAFSNMSFVEGKTQAMKLEDVDAEIFGLLVNWLYQRRIEFDDKQIEERAASKVNEARLKPGVVMGEKLMLSAKLWVLADRFLMHTLQNDTAETILPLLRVSGGLVLEEFGRFAYNKKLAPLKRMMIDFLGDLSEPKLMLWITRGRLPEGICAELALALVRLCDKLPDKQRPKMMEAGSIDGRYRVKVEGGDN